MKMRLSALALTVNLLAAAVAFAAPELTVEQGTYNFGTVNQGKKVQHSFTIRNSGDAPLQIKQLTASCGCTAAKPSSSVIPPGRSAEVAITFDSANFSGKVQKSVLMATNAGKSPNYTFNLVGSVLEELQVTPRQLSLGALSPSGSKQAMLTVTNHSASPVKILAVNVNSTSMRITPSIKKSDLKPGESGTVEISVSPRPEAKILSGYIHILTNSPQKKEITVPVYATGVK
jgi:uncharacterized membrane protein